MLYIENISDKKPMLCCHLYQCVCACVDACVLCVHSLLALPDTSSRPVFSSKAPYSLVVTFTPPSAEPPSLLNQAGLGVGESPSQSLGGMSIVRLVHIGGVFDMCPESSQPPQYTW